jgi:hypothetical protein
MGPILTKLVMVKPILKFVEHFLFRFTLTNFKGHFTLHFTGTFQPTMRFWWNLSNGASTV